MHRREWEPSPESDQGYRLRIMKRSAGPVSLPKPVDTADYLDQAEVPAVSSHQKADVLPVRPIPAGQGHQENRQ